MRLLNSMHDRVGVLLHLARQRFVDDVCVGGHFLVSAFGSVSYADVTRDFAL
jgi:hypothetical protein